MAFDFNNLKEQNDQIVQTYVKYVQIDIFNKNKWKI